MDINDLSQPAERSEAKPTEADPELLIIKSQRAKLLAKRIELIKRFGLAYYKPHAKQDAFHKAGGKFKRRMVRAGNRFGKSKMGCAEDCAWLIGERPWYPAGDSARTAGIPNHPVKGLVITEDWDKVDEIWTGEKGERGGKIWEFLSRDMVKSVRRNHSGSIDTIELKRGSLLRFDTVKSFKANPLGAESSDWDFIHVDEPCPEDMWKAVARGLIDRGGSAWFTLTPLREPWINDYFFPGDTRGQARSDVWAETGSTYDNPFLSPEAIADYEKDLNEDEKQCRILGIPLHLSGLVYKQFSWAKHVLQALPDGWKCLDAGDRAERWVPPLDWSHYFYIDPHPQTPHSVLFCALDNHGRRFYYHELFIHCSIPELAHKIRGVLGQARPIWGKIDPFAFINDPITETNMAIELEDNGVFVEKATKAKEQGILKVQGELKKTADHQSIFFTPTLRRLLWEIQRYCWDEKENKAVDKDDHFMENLYRAELSEMRFVDRSAPSREIRDVEITRADLDFEPLNFSM